MNTTALKNWMSWEGGVDLVALTRPGLAMPNVIVHVARQVHTPAGSAPSGIIFWQPDPAQPPTVMGFVSHDDAKVGPYFGPNIFADTPFQNAPVLRAQIEIETGADFVASKVTVGAHVFRTRLSGLQPATLVHRSPAPMSPFWQQGVEAVPTGAQLWANDEEISILLPPASITAGPAAVSAPCGIYAR